MPPWSDQGPKFITFGQQTLGLTAWTLKQNNAVLTIRKFFLMFDNVSCEVLGNEISRFLLLFLGENNWFSCTHTDGTIQLKHLFFIQWLKIVTWPVNCLLIDTWLWLVLKRTLSCLSSSLSIIRLSFINSWKDIKLSTSGEKVNCTHPWRMRVVFCTHGKVHTMR